MAPVKRSLIPRQVIPLENETDSDIRDTTRWMIVLAGALIGGAVLVATVLGIDIISVVLGIGGAVMAAAIPVIQRKSRQVNEPQPPYLRAVERGERTVFDYSNYSNAGDSMDAGQFLGGFVLAIVMSLGTLMGIGVARQAGRGMPVVFISVAVIFFIYIAVRAFQNWQRRSFFQGMIAGVMVGVVGCGPCAVMGLLG